MVHQIAPFHTESFPECLCVISENMLSVGSLDEIQKLHIRSIPLGEMPRRIAYEVPGRIRVFLFAWCHFGAVVFFFFFLILSSITRTQSSLYVVWRVR
jgi:hypothetical protein